MTVGKTEIRSFSLFVGGYFLRNEILARPLREGYLARESKDLEYTLLHTRLALMLHSLLVVL